jgi:hypothetical protein
VGYKDDKVLRERFDVFVKQGRTIAVYSTHNRSSLRLYLYEQWILRRYFPDCYALLLFEAFTRVAVKSKALPDYIIN